MVAARDEGAFEKQHRYLDLGEGWRHGDGQHSIGKHHGESADGDTQHGIGQHRIDSTNATIPQCAAPQSSRIRALWPSRR